MVKGSEIIMLEGLRVASQNWFGRIVMGLVMGFIAITFAIWGVGDVFRGFTSSRLARVGSGEVTVEAYKASYQNELRRIQQRLRRNVTNEEARAAGLDLQILERLITDVALDQKAHALGLAIGDDTILRQLESEKAFQGPDGKFNATAFKNAIRDSGYTERGFLQDQKTNALRHTLTDLVSGGVEPPKLMIEAIYRFRNEARAIDWLLIPATSAPAPAAPSDEELKKYFSDHEQTFRARETRKITLLAATLAASAKPADVPEADVRKLYDEVKAQRYGTAEKRHVRQIVFKTRADADAAVKRLEGGVAFDTLIAEAKLSPKDADLGVIEQRDIGDASLAADVFALPKIGFTAPHDTPFGSVVSEVSQIVPGVYVKTYEAAATELRAELAEKKAAPEVRRLRDAIEEQRAAAKPLAEVAKAVGLETRTIDGVDDQGHDRNGLAIADIPGGADLLKAVFASDVGVDNDVVPTRDNGYVWFEVVAVEQARQKTFEEVKDAVRAAMTAEAQQKALTAKADELVAKVKAGQAIELVAKEIGAEVKRATDVKRASRADFANDAIVAFFSVPTHGAGSVATDKGRLLFYVQDAQTPKFDPASIEARTIAQQLKPSLENDLLEQYVGGLEKTLGVDINQKALRAATGGEPEK